jgi:hypothetical protein
VATGRPSAIEVHPIIALRGAPKINLFDVVPGVTKLKLFRRDRCTLPTAACASPNASCSASTSCRSLAAAAGPG